VASVDLVLKLTRTGDGRFLCFELPTQEARNVVWDLVEKVGPKHNDFLRVTLDVPARKVKTGPRGQVNRHWGHCTEIAEQLTSEEAPVTKEMVDVFLRRRAVRDGFPTFYNILEDAVEPVHFNAALSVEHANIIELVKRQFVDKIPLWLTEYDDRAKPYKSVQGRTRDEMKIYWREEAKKRERNQSG
jgi:hypothetical protein